MTSARPSTNSVTADARFFGFLVAVRPCFSSVRWTLLTPFSTSRSESHLPVSIRSEPIRTFSPRSTWRMAISSTFSVAGVQLERPLRVTFAAGYSSVAGSLAGMVAADSRRQRCPRPAANFSASPFSSSGWPGYFHEKYQRKLLMLSHQLCIRFCSTPIGTRIGWKVLGTSGSPVCSLRQRLIEGWARRQNWLTLVTLGSTFVRCFLSPSPVSSRPMRCSTTQKSCSNFALPPA